MPDPRDALRAWFLGPRAENADLLERLVTEALRDHVFWRRNYHPEDGFTISERDRRAPGYEEAVATLTQELLGLLAELKRDVPFFSGRYKGHMVFEQTIAAQVGYFAAMLYNPNNVALEAAPVTTRLELEVARQLAGMIGYDPDAAWGHLTGGGTIANFEALWIARNIAYLPLAVRWAAADLGVQVPVGLPGGSTADLGALDLHALLNLQPADALDAWQRLKAAAPPDVVARAVARHTLGTAGYQEYSRRIAAAYPDPLPDSVVLVAATAHYSWEKVVRALGIGGGQLRHVAVDAHCRMDPDALWETLSALARSRTPVMALVSVCGSTEESAMDRLDLVLDVRARAAAELGLAFHLHSDACYGGYAAAVTRDAAGERRDGAAIRRDLGGPWPTDEWVASAGALAGTDSITIDPHKLGYVPYPAGAFLCRDRRARDLVAVTPPYLAPAGGDPTGEEFLGRFIFEGSKPGAAAAAVWLSHKVLPLDERGYGYLIGQTALGARRLHAALAGADLGEFRTVLLPEPDINIVCWVVAKPGAATLGDLNRFNEGIYRELSLHRPGGGPEYIITRTRFEHPQYDGAVPPLLERLGVGSLDEWRGPEGGLVVLRATVMDPFLAAPPPVPDHVTGFVAALRRAARTAAERRDG
jgi:glutamate/tyrosine decarboxylase-like PLP-dependent enzyme